MCICIAPAVDPAVISMCICVYTRVYERVCVYVSLRLVDPTLEKSRPNQLAAPAANQAPPIRPRPVFGDRRMIGPVPKHDGAA